MKVAIKWSLVAILSNLFTAVLAAKSTHQLSTQFIQWMSKHGKDYQTVEEFWYRFDLYSERDGQIEQVFESGLLRPTQLTHNKFSDQSP